MRYVVTGAAGFIGSHLVEELVGAGHSVLAIDCFTDYYDIGLKEENAAGFEVSRIDLAADALDLTGCDGIFHLAGRPGVRSITADFPTYVRSNVLASEHVFQAAAAAGARVVLASTSSVYGSAAAYPTSEETPLAPVSAYAMTKEASEELARTYARHSGLDVVVLRYFTVYGPRQRPDMLIARAINALIDETPLEIYGDGSQSRAFSYVADTVAATISAMEAGRASTVYNVGGSEEATIRETIATLEQIAGSAIDIRYGPKAIGDVLRTSADTSRIRAELGWEPRVRLADGLRLHWQWAESRALAGSRSAGSPGPGYLGESAAAL